MDSRNKSGRKCVLVKASWENEAVKVGSLVRMKWRVKNETDDVVIIEGYRVEKYTPRDLTKYDIMTPPVDEEKEQKQHYISDTHFATILWPNESRTYSWAFVPTEYYGIRKKGEWGYRVIIKYRQGDTLISKYIGSQISSITVTSGTKQMNIRTFLQEFKSQIKDLPHLSENYQTKIDFRLSHIGIIDGLLIGSDFVMILSLQPNEIDRLVLNQMRRFLNWARDAYRQQYIIGLIVASNSNAAYESERRYVAMPSDTFLLIGYIENDRIRLTETP